MELALRILAFVATILSIIINTLLNWMRVKQKPTYPPIRNKLLTKSVTELVIELREKKLTSEELVKAYISRIEEVNPSLNCVVEDRFAEAIKEAQHADQLIARAESIPTLFARYPLLGIPFTVKESCGVKGLSFTVGSIQRSQVKCPQDGEVVELFRQAGCIPLLVSANPEFCLSFETNTHTMGTVSNPYDLNRTPAGSSGGEGALNGSGSTLFGVGSDLAGSVRLPALFCGVFGHKPTGGLVSIKGHFPSTTTDTSFPNYLQLGPLTRFGRDLPILMQIMAGANAEKLKFTDIFPTKDIKIYYSYGYDGLNILTHPPTAFDIKLSITRAVKYFQNAGNTIKEVKIKNVKNITEMGIASLVSVEGVPSCITQSAQQKPRRSTLIFEVLRSLIGHSMFTKEAIFMELMINLSGLMPANRINKWRQEADPLKAELLHLLGNDGVLLVPSYHTPAIHKHMSVLNMVGIDLMLMCNILGFPATQIPMGLDERGLPVGFQVIAAPYQDKLCLQIATELEAAFGGWVPPIENEI